MAVSHRILLVLSTVILLTASYCFAQGRKTPQPLHDENQAALMLAKLSSSQVIVDGLVSNDFDQIRRGATDLKRICDAISWTRNKDQVYAHHRTEMRRLTEKLITMAEKKNLDGAAFTYMHSLTVCISCHQHCRDVLQISDTTKSTNKVVPIPTREVEARLPGTNPIHK